MKNALVNLVNISKSFDNQMVLDDLNLYIRENEFLTLLGPSGCGKTTTLRILGGFETPDKGQVIFEGRDITNLPPNKRNLNTVFQKYALFPHMTIAENIAFGLKISGKSKSYINDKIKYALKLVNLDGFENRMPDSLSGGQQQRIAIARAIVNEPKLLLLDEPLGALDLKLRQDMQYELIRLKNELGITFVYVTHDQEEALTMSDRIAVMNAGVIEQLGTYIGGFLQDLAASAGGVVARTLPDVLVHTIVVLLSSYLFLAEHDVIVQRIKDVMPGAVKRYMGLIKKDVRQVIGGYFLAQFKIMFVVALVLMGGLMLLGVRYWAVLAVAIALLDFLPMFGTGTVLIPWAAVKLFTGDFAYAAGLGLLYVLSQAVRQIIQPKIVGDSMGLPPLTTLFFLFLGYRLRGLAGMILAVPVGLIFIKFYEYGAFDSLINSVKELAREIEEIRHGDGKEP